MTEENYNYRTSPLFLRNQFKETGDFGIPQIPKSDFSEDELKDLLLIGFDKARTDKLNFDRMVHFFLYDYNFESIWKKPDDYVDKLKEYKGVLSPDFSMYIEMNRAVQIYNTFRNRWCGAYLASKGIKVIPTVNWGNEDTFDFCFDGIPEGSIVAVSTYMVHEHNNHSDQKEFFLKGYNEMLKRIKPDKVICYSEPFDEMEGDIIYVDYELSGWKYLNREAKSLPARNGGGIIVYKTMIQPEGFASFKGTGSAYGGPWKPSKPEDERFLGEPNTIKTFFFKYRIDVKYGPDGRGVKERQFTDHRKPWAHTDPHDHLIVWENPDGSPTIKEHINYPDGAPDFTLHKGELRYMSENIIDNTEDRFESISEFKRCIKCGGEIEFAWKGKYYSITHPEGRINIGEGYYVKDGKCYNALSHDKCIDVEGLWGDTADEILEYVMDGDRLRDVITQVEIMARTL